MSSQDALPFRRAPSRPITFPWSELDDILSSTGYLSLAGYGSLMNSRSLAETVAVRDASHGMPIIARGAIRVFDYIIPSAFLKQYGVPDGSNECAALNLRWTGRQEDHFNARLVRVASTDLDLLREREHGYDLVPVALERWHKADRPPATGYALCAPPSTTKEALTNPRSLPCAPYLEKCLQGASEVSTHFRDFFIHSTYLADGQTPLESFLSWRTNQAIQGRD